MNTPNDKEAADDRPPSPWRVVFAVLGVLVVLSFLSTTWKTIWGPTTVGLLVGSTLAYGVMKANLKSFVGKVLLAGLCVTFVVHVVSQAIYKQSVDLIFVLIVCLPVFGTIAYWLGVGVEYVFRLKRYVGAPRRNELVSYSGMAGAKASAGQRHEQELGKNVPQAEAASDDWALAVKYHPRLVAYAESLGIVDHALASKYREAMLSRGEFDQAGLVAGEIIRVHLNEKFSNEILLAAAQILLHHRPAYIQELHSIATLSKVNKPGLSAQEQNRLLGILEATERNGVPGLKHALFESCAAFRSLH